MQLCQQAARSLVMLKVQIKNLNSHHKLKMTMNNCKNHYKSQSLAIGNKRHRIYQINQIAGNIIYIKVYSKIQISNNMI